ncbi:MAG: hypothetical protein JJE52_08610 [Acidimicrobiia bacterium]|nr:hypothetical protein [Acidimicrobiia bacterium]
MSLVVGAPPLRRPNIELLLEPGSGAELGLLISALSAVARPSAPHHELHVDARLLSSPTAPEAGTAHRDHNVPFAVLVRSAAELDHPLCASATVLLVRGDDELLAAAGARGVALPTLPVDTDRVVPVPPHVRAAMQGRYGLPSPLVIGIGRPGSPALDDAQVATAARLASVVDAVGPAAAIAMALGAPVVTDTHTARLLGAVHDVHVVIAEGAESAAAAASLADDTLRCARLGRAGRLLVEERHDPARTARELVRRLGLTPISAWPAAVGVRVGSRLRELGTPSDHPIERQLSDRLGDLDVPIRSGGL